MNATVTLTWGFGSFLPLPVMVYFDINNLPDWLYASPSMHSFTVTPKGLSGGDETRIITITLTSNKETGAYSYDSFDIHAYTNGSFLMKGSEAENKVTVSQAFNDRGISTKLSDSNINVIKGESKKSYLNITNMCNGDIYIKINVMNLSSAWKVSSTQTDFVIPSKYTGDNSKSIPLTFRASGNGAEEGWINVTYYPSANENWGEKTVTIPVMVKSTEAGVSGGAIATAILLLLIVAVIIAVVWSKYRKA
jgi:hypothetical protein